jgi:hypothetical protein
MASRQPLSPAETLERIRELHVSILESSLDVDKFLTSLNCLNLSSARAASAACSAIVSALIFQSDFSATFPRLVARAIAKILQSDSEIVARSCLTPISLLSHTAHLPAVIAKLADTFPDWTPRAQELMLAFVFSLVPRVAAEWAAFVPHMDLARSSTDEFLSAIADEFVSYLAQIDAERSPPAVDQPPDDGGPEEDLEWVSPPPAQEKLRRSLDFKRADTEPPALPAPGVSPVLPAKKRRARAPKRLRELPRDRHPASAPCLSQASCRRCGTRTGNASRHQWT